MNKYPLHASECYHQHVDCQYLNSSNSLKAVMRISMQKKLRYQWPCPLLQSAGDRGEQPNVEAESGGVNGRQPCRQTVHAGCLQRNSQAAPCQSGISSPVGNHNVQLPAHGHKEMDGSMQKQTQDSFNFRVKCIYVFSPGIQAKCYVHLNTKNSEIHLNAEVLLREKQITVKGYANT